MCFVSTLPVRFLSIYLEKLEHSLLRHPDIGTLTVVTYYCSVDEARKLDGLLWEAGCALVLHALSGAGHPDVIDRLPSGSQVSQGISICCYVGYV